MLRKIRIVLAALFWVGITLLFLDFTGTLHAWLGWMAKIQFLPAILALNFGVVIGLVVLTLLFGRVYCSIICPLGVFQDIISWAHGKTKKKNRFRFSYSPAKNWLRYGVLALFIIAMVAGASQAAALIAPYSAYGRIVSNLFAPVYQWGNNLLAYFAERLDSYAFYSHEVWLRSLPTFIIAAITFIIIFILAWKGGRTYCNTICPVGTILGTLSRFSLFAPVIDESKCRACGLCGRQCKASCIDMKAHEIDYSRCVACMDCIEICHEGAIKYTRRRKTDKSGMTSDGMSGKVPNDMPRHKDKKDNGTVDQGRRAFMTSALIATAGIATMKAQDMKVDGGLAEVFPKKAPKRLTAISPAGSLSLRHFTQHCTACQLCVSVCPNQVLRPSTALETLMQPEMSYEKGYCRPECTKCSDVCPAGAIRPISREEKSSIQIGHAVLDYQLCLPFTEDVHCGNCARHCPAGAISMVRKDAVEEPDTGKARPNSMHSGGKACQGNVRIPVVNTERCIGCGACENLCPARPVSAIHVEGHEIHKFI